MTSTRSLIILFTGLVVAGPALAQTVASQDQAVSTAAHRLDAQAAAQAQAQAAPVAPAPAPRILTTDEQIAQFLAASPALERGQGLAGLAPVDEADAKRKIHGSAGVTVGTGGYRSAYVSTLIPIGETSTLGLAYSQTDPGKNSIFYPHDSYGYGDYDRGGWNGDSGGLGRPGHWGRGGQRQSVAISLAVGGEGKGPPEGCAPAFRADGRYVEPLWASEMRAAEMRTTQIRGRYNPCGAP